MEFTRPATWDDVRRLAGFLAEAGVEYALVGGYAVAAHGFNRFSEDIDILVNPSAANAKRWIAALSRLPDGSAMELSDEQDVFAADRRYAIRINDEFTVDVMPSVAGVPFATLEQHAERLVIDGEPIPVLDLQGLLDTKQQSERPKDQADAALLREALARLSRRSESDS